MATESAAAVFLSMLLTASPQALAGSIDNNPQRQEPAGAISDTLRLTLTDVFTRIENENQTMSMLRTARMPPKKESSLPKTQDIRKSMPN